MIDPSTGMKPGERYSVESVERGHQFHGFFLDGKYYLGPELLTAVGWLEGQQFIYDNLDPSGEPVFPERIAGTVENLTLTLVDGTPLTLSSIDEAAFEGQPSLAAAAEQYLPEGSSPASPSRGSMLLGLAAAMLLGSYVGVVLGSRRR
jgi:hypothetical protein